MTQNEECDDVTDDAEHSDWKTQIHLGYVPKLIS